MATEIDKEVLVLIAPIFPVFASAIIAEDMSVPIENFRTVWFHFEANVQFKMCGPFFEKYTRIISFETFYSNN